MRREGRRRGIVGLGLACLVIGAFTVGGACSYPTFGFVDDDAGPQDDTSFDSAASDSGATPDSSTSDGTVGDADAAIDSSTDDSTVTDTATTSDSSKADSKADSAIDSGTDTKTDTFVVVDSGADVSEVLATCGMVDDMEDGNEQVLVKCTRRGYWFTFNDGTTGGVQTPDPSIKCLPSTATGRTGSTWAMHTNGTGFTDWGGGIGFHFISSSTAYDARPFTGIAFWARVGTGGTKFSMRVDLPDGDTDPGGGVCGTMTGGCYDHFGTTLTLDGTWKYYVIRFSSLTQGGWGWPRTAYDPSRAFGMQIQAGAGGTFDIWLDDVQLVP